MPGQETSESAIITVTMPDPSTAVSRMARIRSGKAKMMSAVRITAVSSQPPR